MFVGWEGDHICLTWLIILKNLRTDYKHLLYKNTITTLLVGLGWVRLYPQYPLASRRFSTLSILQQTKIDPNYVTGLSDAEGCFKVIIQKNSSYNTGWVVKLEFSINMHTKDKKIIRDY